MIEGNIKDLGANMDSSKLLMRQAQVIAERASFRKRDETRHKCFIAYHVADIIQVESFLDTFGEDFIPKSIGVTDEDDFIDSDNEDYVKKRIREDYLSDSTVTIVLLGECTWARKFIDWEISASLRDDPVNKRSGLLVYPLPSMNNKARLPERVRENHVNGVSVDSYAFYYVYPISKSVLRNQIEEAFQARTGKADKVNNSRRLMGSNDNCG
jgi:hypothetical protein